MLTACLDACKVEVWKPRDATPYLCYARTRWRAFENAGRLASWLGLESLGVLGLGSWVLGSMQSARSSRVPGDGQQHFAIWAQGLASRPIKRSLWVLLYGCGSNAAVAAAAAVAQMSIVPLPLPHLDPPIRVRKTA